MLPSAQNLLWVKNIKYENGSRWAYMDDEHKDEFSLEFSKKWQSGADKPKVGDVILLFQTTDIKQYKGTYLTHLVTPIYETGETTKNDAFPRSRRVKVIARAGLPNPIKMPNELIFFKPNRGQVLDLQLIERYNGGSRRNGDTIPLAELQAIIWNLFEGHFQVS